MMLSSLARILFLSIVLTGLLAVSVAAQDVAIDGTVTARQPDGSLRAADVIVALIVGQDFANARFTRTNAQGTYSFAAVPRDGTFSLVALLPNPNQPILLTGLKNVRPAVRTRYDIIVELADLEAARKELEQVSRSAQGSDAPKPSTNDEQLADLKASLDEVMRLRDVGTKESFESAIAILQQMLIKVRQQKDQQGEIVVLSLLGRCYTRLGERQKAIDAFQASLPLIRARRDRDMEAITLRNIGLTYELVGEKQQAVACLEQAIAIFHELGDARNESETRKSYEEVRAGTYATGERVTQPRSVKDGRGDRALALAEEAFALMKQGTSESLRAAIVKMDEARVLFREIGDAKLEALMWGNAGNIYQMLGEKDKALEYYEQQLGPLRRSGDRLLEASTLSNIGVVYDDQGDREKALAYFNQALQILQPLGDAHGLSTLYSNFAVVYIETGETARALDYLQKALALARESKDQRLEGKALSNLAQAYTQTGQTQLAIETHQQSIALLRAAGLPAEAAWEINNMAALYYDLGDRDKALALLNEALPLLRAAGDRAGQARVLSSLGKASFDVGDYRRALEIFQQAKTLAEAVGDRQVIAAIHNGLGLTYQALGQAQPALENYLSALRLSREVHDPLRETNTLVNLGRFSIATNQLAEGAQFFQLAMQRGRAIGDTFIEAMALGGLAVIERQRGNLDEARRNIEAAVRLFEARRVQVVSQDLRASFFATVQDYYQLQIDVLMRLHKERPNQGFDALALQASEQGRARSLLETLAEASADIRQGVDPQLVERERSLQKQLNTAAQTQQKILSSNHAEQQAANIAQEIQRLTTDLQQVQTQIRQKSPSYASLTQPQPLSLKEIQTEVLDDDTVLLEYSLGEERSYLWLVTPSSISSYELPPRKEIETAARELYELLNRPEQWSSGDLLEGLRQLDREPKAKPAQTPDSTKRAVPDVATRLSRTLVAPVWSRIAGKRLLIVADGALQYVPFGALSSPESDDYRPLIIDHEIVSSPSASTVAVLRQEVKGRRPADKSVAVLADPVFEASDERVKSRNSSGATTSTALQTSQRNVPSTLKRSAMEAGLRGESQIDRLPGTRNEAQQIMALVPPDQGKQALDFLANRETATSAELSRYQYVHFATHGFLNSVHPELSGIVLSLIDEKGQTQDGFLRAHEIYNLKLPAELVVLSACQTGLGKEIKGEGLVGLTRGFMYAGAPRVVVSLWSVNDAATAELMSRFYRGMLRDKLKPAAALRAAQVSLIKEKQWQAPFFWAAFTLQGEWR